MKLINMKKPKLTKEEMKEQAVEIPSPEGEDRYPYGLRIRLQSDEVAKIESLQKIEAGAMVMIKALGKVTEVSVVDSEDDKRRTVEIQIHEIGIADKAGDKEAFKEYSEKEK